MSANDEGMGALGIVTGFPERAADKSAERWPCHQKPREEWCDRDGPGGFMGHTCLVVPGMFVRRAELVRRVGEELTRAYLKHGREQWGRHEFYAILLEEVEELWAAIKADEPMERVEAELVQVAAMCFRFYETQDRYRKGAPLE